MKKGVSPAVFILVLVIVVVGGLFVVAKLDPVKIGLLQEQTISVVKGGVLESNEESYIDACVEVKIGNEVKRGAVRRIRRTTRYRDGSEMVITFSQPPEINPQCP